MSRRMAHSRRTHHSLDVLFRFAKRTKSRASQNKLGRPNSAGAFVEPATSRSSGHAALLADDERREDQSSSSAGISRLGLAALGIVFGEIGRASMPNTCLALCR